MDEPLLDDIQIFIKDMNSSNKLSIKLNKLADAKHLKTLFKYTYDPNIKYHISSSSIIKRNAELKTQDMDYTGKKYEKLYELLEYLTKTNSSHESRDSVLYYISKYPKYKTLIYTIIDKKKKLGINIGKSSIIKVFPGLFIEFDVALGESFENAKKQFKKSLDNGDVWYISRKYDGVRCILKCSGTWANPVIKTFSRYGKSLKTLNVVINYVKDYVIRAVKLIYQNEHTHIASSNMLDIVLDGEIIVEDKKGHEDFTTTVGDIRRKDYNMENPRYKVFDILTHDEFSKKKSVSLFSERLNSLNKLLDKVSTLEPTVEIISVISQYIYNDKTFSNLLDESTQNNWEGLMLRKDSKYKGKRSKDIIKVKKGGSKELKVIEITSSTKKILENSIMVEQPILGAVVVENDYDDKIIKVHVGSGFSDQQRLDWYKNPNKIIGKTIRVNYMQEEPTGSLRHPTFKGIVGNNQRDI